MIRGQICSICKRYKYRIYFGISKRTKDGMQSECKKCHQDQNKLYYTKPKAISNQLKYMRLYRADKRIWLDNIKQTKGCKTCRENNPACLQFHHINPEKKIRTISRFYSGTWSKKSIQKEINKCIILCANCHLKHHRKEDNVNRIR